MGKSKNSKYYNYHLDKEYDDVEVYETRSNRDRFKEKRFDRALKTKNIHELIEFDNEGHDPIDFDDEGHDLFDRDNTNETEMKNNANLRLP